MSTATLFSSLGRLNWLVALFLTLFLAMSISYKISDLMLDPFGGVLIREPSVLEIIISIGLFLVSWLFINNLFSIKLNEGGYITAAILFILIAIPLVLVSYVIGSEIAIYRLTP